MEHRCAVAVKGSATDFWAQRLRQGYDEERPLMETHVTIKHNLLLAVMIIEADDWTDAHEEAQYAFTDAACAAALPPGDVVAFTIFVIAGERGGPPYGE